MIKFLREVYFLISRIQNIIILRLNKVIYSKVHIYGRVLIFNKGTFKIGENTKINSSKYKNIIGGDTRTSIIVQKDAILIIGKNVKISNSAFQCAKSITIGNNVMIGGSCKIWDTDFHSIDPEIRKNMPNENALSSPIIIGENVFIGGFSIILKGVSIGNNSIIAAGSVVSKNIPDDEIWGGNPVKFIKKLSV